MKTKTVKIALEGFGSYLGMEKGCFTVKNREGNTQKYPLFESEIDEIIIKSGNTVSYAISFFLSLYYLDIYRYREMSHTHIHRARCASVFTEGY
jgi:hypothetical protein